MNAKAMSGKIEELIYITFNHHFVKVFNKNISVNEGQTFTTLLPNIDDKFTIFISYTAQDHDSGSILTISTANLVLDVILDAVTGINNKLTIAILNTQ